MDKFDIVKTLDRLSIPYEGAGSYLKVFCPFHKGGQETTPSLTVYPNTNTFYCFGCSRWGDAIDLTREKLGCDFIKAKEWLEVNVSNTIAAKEEKLPEIKMIREIHSPIDLRLVTYWNKLLWKTEQAEWFLERGFCESFINSEQFGWDGKRFTIPVWYKSICVAVRLRRWDELGKEGPKYLGIKKHKAYIWGEPHCRGQEILFGFVGELDAANAVQDGLPAFSLVNGQLTFQDKSLPRDWFLQFFPEVRKVFIIFDKGEELSAAKFQRMLKRVDVASEIFLWPVFEEKDYNGFRNQYSFRDFGLILRDQVEDPKSLDKFFNN